MLELLDRDAATRICKWSIGKHVIQTPTILPVVNPAKQIITPKELKEFGADIIITNSYIINKNEEIRKKVLKQGLHKFLKWKGPIYTDSGSFQFYSQDIKDIDQRKIINFQKRIGSDIITPVDMFTFLDDNKQTAKKKLLETIKRIKAARKLVKGNLVAPIQGGMFLDFRKQACKQAAKTNPDLFAIGGVVPLMEEYRFKELCDIIITCKQNLPTNKIVHVFGAGHPISFALLTAIGADIFDSAMYALAAKRDAYLTLQGTKKLDELTELPCACPVCANHTAKELKDSLRKDRQKLLARHNLYVTFGEIRTIRQAIRDNNLFELVQQRCRAHPKLLEAFLHVLKNHKKYFLERDPVTKKSALFWSQESEFRPEVVRAREKLKKIKSKKYFTKQPFGKIPIGLKDLYPFSQSITLDEPVVKADPEQMFSQTVEYLYSKSSIQPKIEVSRKTGRSRRAIYKGRLLGTFRPSDGFFLPTMCGASLIKMKKVLVNPDAAEYAVKGKSVFAKFVIKADNIIPGEEVAVYYGKKLLAVGRALMNSREMKEFDRGVAVKIRAHK